MTMWAASSSDSWLTVYEDIINVDSGMCMNYVGIGLWVNAGG